MRLGSDKAAKLFTPTALHALAQGCPDLSGNTLGHEAREDRLRRRRYTRIDCGVLCNAFSVNQFNGSVTQGRPLPRPTLG